MSCFQFQRLQAEQTRREFSANVSHELKTPLTSISGYAEIIRDGLVKPEDISLFAGKIHDESARLVALVGPQRVKEMLMLAKLIDAQAALACGLVSELLPDPAALYARAEELARTLAGHAPITMQVTKEALRRLQARLGDENIDDLVRLAYGSADFREGMAAFLEKRAPKWSGA